jgi:hypothetical protein
MGLGLAVVVPTRHSGGPPVVVGIRGVKPAPPVADAQVLRHDGVMSDVPACARCGRDADFDFVDLWLCLDCYHIAGSTCAGVGRPAAVATTAGSRPSAGAGDPNVVGGTDPVC